MKHVKYLFLAAFLFGMNMLVFSQRHLIANEVREMSKKFPDQKTISVLTRDKNFSDLNIKKSVTKSAVFDYNKDKALEIIKTSPDFISLEIQNDEGETLILDLFNASKSFSELTVNTSEGKRFEVNQFKAAFYRGIIRGQEESLVSISFFEKEISGFISNQKGNYVIGKMKDSDKIIVYNDKNLSKTPSFDCEMPNIPLGKGEIGVYANADKTENIALTFKCVRLYFETEYDIFQNKGSVANVIAYVTNLYNQSATLYANDGISTTLSEIKVWNTADPYNATSASGLLTEFQNQTNSINGTLGQLLTFRAIGGGIAAGFSGICNANVDNSLCVSGNLESTFPNVPTYSWSVMVVTHELGHLFGSRHTHACVWNGNNTAIDGCAGFTEGGCPLPSIPSGGGTIMSYCHLQSVGINFSNGFGPQPANVILNNVNNAPCLTSCGPCPTLNSYEPNETLATAYPINTNTPYTAGITSATDQDFYAFTLTGASNVTITLQNLPDNYDIQILNSIGSEIGAGTSGGTNNETVTLTNLAAGTYYVNVYGNGGAMNTFSCYDLNVQATLIPVCPTIDSYEPNETGFTGYPINFNTTYKAGITTSTDVDFYKFAITDASIVTVILQNLPANYDVQITNVKGSFVLGGSYNTGTANETITLNNLPAGNYCVKVYGYGGEMNTISCYSLKVFANASKTLISKSNVNEESSMKDALTISPNPNDGNFKILIDQNIKEGTLQIVDLMGKSIYEKSFKNQNELDINIHDKPKGVYVVRIISKDQVISEKTIVK